jgi:hypothetical protein
MIIYNIHVEGMSAFPQETYPPLVIDPDAVLPLSIPFEPLQPICRRNTQILESHGPMQHPKLSEGNILDVSR